MRERSPRAQGEGMGGRRRGRGKTDHVLSVAVLITVRPEPAYALVRETACDRSPSLRARPAQTYRAMLAQLSRNVTVRLKTSHILAGSATT